MPIPPTAGRIVLYTLSTQDAELINSRRMQAAAHTTHAEGAQLHLGNTVAAGEVYPLVITRVWGAEVTSSVNGQLLLDGNDTHWVTSVNQGTGPRTWAWPVKF